MAIVKTLLEAAEAADFFLSIRQQPRPTKEQWAALISVLVVATACGVLARLVF